MSITPENSLCSNPTDNHHSNVYHHKSVLPLLEHHILHGIHAVCLLICVWFLSLNKHVFELHLHCI